MAKKNAITEQKSVCWLWNKVKGSWALLQQLISLFSTICNTFALLLTIKMNVWRIFLLFRPSARFLALSSLFDSLNMIVVGATVNGVRIIYVSECLSSLLPNTHTSQSKSNAKSMHECVFVCVCVCQFFSCIYTQTPVHSRIFYVQYAFLIVCWCVCVCKRMFLYRNVEKQVWENKWMPMSGTLK